MIMYSGIFMMNSSDVVIIMCVVICMDVSGGVVMECC